MQSLRKWPKCKNLTKQRQQTMESRSRLSIDSSFELNSSRCLPWPTFHGFSTYSLWEMTWTQKLNKTLQNQWTVDSRSRLSIDGSFKLLWSKCLHVPCSMALAFIVSYSHTFIVKLNMYWTYDAYLLDRARDIRQNHWTMKYRSQWPTNSMRSLTVSGWTTFQSMMHFYLIR